MATILLILALQTQVTGSVAGVVRDTPSRPITGSPAPMYDGFSVGLFRELTRVAPDSNVFLSPASAAFALAMTYGGSGGKTETAMAHALGVDGAAPEKLGPENAKLLKSLDDQKDVQLTIANSIWAGAGKPFLRAFLDSTRNNYHAEVRSMVLHGPVAQHEINDWVATATHDKIRTLLADTLPDQTAMVLLNAVYFKGLWKDKFDTAATRSHSFTLAGGRVVSRKLMYRHADMQYQRGANFAAVRLPYKGDRIAMYVFLPDSGVPLADLAATIDKDKFGSVRMRLGLPKFHIEYQTTLNDPLKALGMEIAFDPQRAEFSRMLPRSFLRDTNVFISKVVQKTYVDVDEQGTEAAAATGAMMVKTSSFHPEPEMIVDRPFITAIRDDRTGLILFLGQINDPTQR